MGAEARTVSKLPGIIIESTPEGPPIFAANPSGAPPAAVVDDIAAEHDAALLREWWPEGVPAQDVRVRRPIRVRRAFPPYHEDVLPPGWLYDEKGRVRTAKCGHPVHPVKGCRVCPLLNTDDGIQAVPRHHYSEERQIAAAKWGSRKGRRRANAPSSPPVEEPSRDKPEFMAMTDALMWLGWNQALDPSGTPAVYPLVVGDLVLSCAWASEVADALTRICPESSRTIRFRHFPRGGTEADDPLVIGAPLPLLAPLDVDALDVLLSTWGSSVVAQQATLAQTLVDLDLPEEPTTEMAALQALADASDLVD